MTAWRLFRAPITPPATSAGASTTKDIQGSREVTPPAAAAPRKAARSAATAACPPGGGHEVIRGGARLLDHHPDATERVPGQRPGRGGLGEESRADGGEGIWCRRAEVFGRGCGSNSPSFKIQESHTLSTG